MRPLIDRYRARRPREQPEGVQGPQQLVETQGGPETASAHPSAGYPRSFDGLRRESLLVSTAAIFTPDQDLEGSSVPIQSVSLAKVSIEPGDVKGTIYARFLGPASAEGGLRQGRWCDI
jgi:hypothetical protein